MMEESEPFKQGVKDFKEGNVKLNFTEPYWVKQLVSVRDWNGHYKYISSYCFLDKTKEGISIGFCSSYVPEKCELMIDEEMRRVDIQRRAMNVYPRPFRDIKL